MPHSNYPKVFNPDYSPPQDLVPYQEPFEKTYLSNNRDTYPDYPLSTWFDTDSFFDQPLDSIEMRPSGSHYKSTPNPTLPATGIAATDNQPGHTQAFYQPDVMQSSYAQGYSLDPAFIASTEAAPFSPITQSSRTSSLCGDLQEQAYSPSLSPQIIKRESPLPTGASEEQTTPKRPQRKRGRPRLDGLETEIQASSSSSGKFQKTRRLPHNQVERKYREGLNSELERLRKAVPALAHGEDGMSMGQPKPSKAVILSSAIEYIRKIESERDALKEEVERLKQSQNQNQNQSMDWAGHDTSFDDFLLDL
ncbi:hypothetical protein DE146DRAFT_632285 [Phaeosphaeria sp. MPI-PUGE-AT-0046c]|nr:hypothetical protein DE146DRAFT_632285 [Phaeosphaeria sp. MPI-PUGE-AT-0046c]